ncbi:enoyl-CoA hydratase/isomerase family protein [Mycobacteroides abscessus]|uniref:enoyl-CoA hydratase/isomerase family protein n=1 Tax=Mycobacteroides abscessus TaxID=36809 RepID=UPI0002E97384|nr:enoyl-CoA hydratase/isomerase family protein [Mycobacteroides abscessus]
MSWNIDSVGDVAVVTMNSNKVNAQNEEFFLDLHEALDRLETMRAGPVVLTGQGDTFSAGLDLKYTLPLFATQDEEAISAWFERYRATNVRLFTFDRPVIAAVNGHAIAGGLITALACDYRIAAAGGGKFGLNEVPIGIAMPSVYTEIIRYAVGNRAAALMTLFGELFGVEAAQRLGVFDEVVEPGSLIEAAIGRARVVPMQAMSAYAGSKRALQGPALSNIDGVGRKVDLTLKSTFADEGSRAAHDAKLSAL